MKLNKHIPYYGFDHKAVNKKFSGDLTFLNEFCVKGEYKPVAVYKAANPDTSKGHKRYMLLQLDSGGGLVRGMTEEEMDKERFQSGIHCKKCDDVIYSVNRHDMHSCSCKAVSIDGGKDYLRIGGKKEDYEIVKIDLLTDIISKADKVKED
jgi:hypothetical protein